MSAQRLGAVLVPGRVTVDVQLLPGDLRAALRRDARAGLGATPKSMPPVWFYDDRGSALYEDITRLPEYYPFRTEATLLRRAAPELAEAAKARVLVELGSGTSEKTRLLLVPQQVTFALSWRARGVARKDAARSTPPATARARTPRAASSGRRDRSPMLPAGALDAMASASAGLDGYVPFDVSEATLRAAAEAIAAELRIGVHAVVGDFHEHLDGIPDLGEPRLIAFLGSTIGNLAPAQRRGFLAELRAVLDPSDRFLLATDLVKDTGRLVAAYDDARGVTAEFNRNLLHVPNRELDANFVPERFAHVAAWDRDEQWIEMRLRATEAMSVRLAAIDMNTEFAAGEEMQTEISAKFTPERVRSELAAAGLEVTGNWTDPDGDYLLTLARPVVTA
jgi:L-histidine Nalpha-methyltransferase